MLHQGAQRTYIEKRVNMPTKKSHAEIVRDVDAGTKARSFWSARVVDARRLEKIREVSDAYSRGEFGLGEARNILKDYLKAEGYDPHEAGIRNLASTGRLNLILKQNAAMAYSAGEWARMHDPDAMAVFPYVRYHARNDSRTRSEHAHLDGKIFHKDDPFLRTHTPPWEFNCRCWLEEITEKAAGKTPERIQKPTPPDKVTVDSRSGFTFDPARAFEEFDMSSIKDDAYRRETYRKMAQSAMKNAAETTFIATPAKPVPTCVKPKNLAKIKEVIGSVKRSIDEHKDGEEYVFPETKCSFGYIAKERFDAIGMQPEDDVEVFFESPGKADYGMKHWKDHHLKDWKSQDFEEELLRMLSETIWNPLAIMKNTLSKAGKRISITSPDGRYIANLWRRGEQWVYSIQDVWDMSRSKNPRIK